jgi:hypothetical protein
MGTTLQICSFHDVKLLLILQNGWKLFPLPAGRTRSTVPALTGRAIYLHNPGVHYQPVVEMPVTDFGNLLTFANFLSYYFATMHCCSYFNDYHL